MQFQPAPYKTIFNGLLNSALNDFSPANFTSTQPPVNVLETVAGFRLDVAAPGLGKEDFTVKVEKNVLTVTGKKEVKAEEGVKVHRHEFAFSNFERSFRLPQTIDTDSVTAIYNNGILHVELTRKPELQPVVKTIEVA